MNEQTTILAEAISQALEIIERNIMNAIDAKFDALDSSDDEMSETRIRVIAREEADDAIDSADISISAH
jgi:vacuolar-type H+-ATPase subunit H